MPMPAHQPAGPLLYFASLLPACCAGALGPEIPADMQQWTYQQGYPLLNVSMDGQGRVWLHQAPFGLAGTQPCSPDTAWWIPVRLVRGACGARRGGTPPGRFFALVVAREGRVSLVAWADMGKAWRREGGSESRVPCWLAVCWSAWCYAGAQRRP